MATDFFCHFYFFIWSNSIFSLRVTKKIKKKWIVNFFLFDLFYLFASCQVFASFQYFGFLLGWFRRYEVIFTLIINTYSPCCSSILDSYFLMSFFTRIYIQRTRWLLLIERLKHEIWEFLGLKFKLVNFLCVCQVHFSFFMFVHVATSDNFRTNKAKLSFLILF